MYSQSLEVSPNILRQDGGPQNPCLGARQGTFYFSFVPFDYLLDMLTVEHRNGAIISEGVYSFPGNSG